MEIYTAPAEGVQWRYIQLLQEKFNGDIYSSYKRSSMEIYTAPIRGVQWIYIQLLQEEFNEDIYSS